MLLAVLTPTVLAGAVVVAADAKGTAALAVIATGSLVAAVATAAVVATRVRREGIDPLTSAAVSERLTAEEATERTRLLQAALEVRDRFDRAVASVDVEAALLRLTVRAASELLSDHDVALLLSLPEEPRVAWSVRMVGDELLPAEPVSGRPGCVALATGRTTSTPSATALGACAHLDPSTTGSDCSAVCVPFTLADRTLGVVCVTGAPGELPDADRTTTLEHIVVTTGDRLSRIRRRKGPSTPGPIDAVTGLPTGVALRSRVAELVRSHVPFCVASLRIDGTETFKREHGPAGWDDALRLLADTTGGTLRPDDVVCRLDDDRIAAVLAGCATVQAAAALERVRESLVLALTVTGVAHFTCSAGLVDGTRTTSVEEILRLADAAGQAALLQGGNRVVVAPSP